MKDFDLKKYLVENKLTANSRLLSENETDLEKVKEKFKAAGRVFSTFVSYAKAKLLKYLKNSPTQADAQDQYMKIESQKNEQVLLNLHKFDFTETEPMEYFMKKIYHKYKKFEGGKNITQDTISEALDILRDVDNVILKYIDKKVQTYGDGYRGTNVHNALKSASEDVKRALDTYKNIK